MILPPSFQLSSAFLLLPAYSDLPSPQLRHHTLHELVLEEGLVLMVPIGSREGSPHIPQAQTHAQQ
jgi:hypothetical protein